MGKKDHTAAGATGRQKRYILVAGTDTEEQFRTTMLLQRFDYPACTAESGSQALEMVSQALPSLVITDLVLPDMSGMELARQFRGADRSVPVILLMPPGEGTIEARCSEVGATGPCIAKPVQAEDLFRAVQTAIEPTPRSYIRIPIDLPVFINKVKLAGLKGECATYLSEHGLYIRTLKPHSRYDRISIELDVHGHAITAGATVLYTHLPGDGPFQEPGMAVKFISISPEDQAFLRQYIHDTVMRGIVSAKD